VYLFKKTKQNIMDQPKYQVVPKHPIYQKLKILKIRVSTFLTTSNKKKENLQRISEKAKDMAKQKGLIYSFDIFIDSRKSTGSYAIGTIHREECEKCKTIIIGFYSNMVMADDFDLLLTVFHEYCHFLLFYTSVTTDWKYAELIAKNKIPEIYGPHRQFAEENFCETFSYFINGIGLVDSDTVRFFNFLNRSTYLKFGDSYQILS
jgi:archaellum biogenesis ATPase FlaH